MNSTIIKTRLIHLIISSLLIAAGLPAIAQMEEIIVTATKREKTLQEVPTAVSVISGDLVERANMSTLFDLQEEVPGFEARQFQTAADATFFIRGFGNGSNNPGIEPSVIVYVDGVNRTRMQGQLTDLPNVERIEVLKGPQNTLFGKNSSAGVINVVTKKPTQDISGKVSIEAGNYSAKKFQGYLSGGLTDSTAASLSMTVNKRDGYMTTQANDLGLCMQSEGPCSDVMDRNRKSARADIVSGLSDDLEMRIIADYSDVDEICCGVGNVVGGVFFLANQALGGTIPLEDPYTYTYSPNFDPRNQIKNKGIALTLDWDLGFATLTSVTSSRDSDNLHDYDLSFDSANTFARSPKILNLENKSQELRLTSNASELNFDWQVGLFYSEEDLYFQDNVGYGPLFRNYVDLLAGGNGSGAVVDFAESLLANLGYAGGSFSPPWRVTETFTQKDDATSLFANFEYKITDKLTADVGISYFKDEKSVTFDQINTDAFSSRDLVADGFALIYGAGLQQAVTGFLSQAVPQYMAAGLTQEQATAAAMPDAQAFAASQIPAIAAAAAAGSTNPAVNQLLGFQALQFLPGTVPLPNAIEDGSSEDSNVDYSVKLSYQLNDNVTVYGGVATGFKASAWNLSRGSSPTDAGVVAALAAAGIPLPNNAVVRGRGVGPEEATIYEIGAKMVFDKGRLNLAIFDQTIDDFHSNTFVGASFVFVNVEEQVTRGFEFDLVYQPVENVELTLSGLMLDCEYKRNTQAAGGDASGENCEGVHEESFSTSATWLWNVDAMNGFVRLGYSYDSAINMRLPLAGDSLLRTAGYAERERGVLNASAGFSFRGYNMTLWGKNLTDDEYLHTVAPNAATNETQWFGYPNAPRMYGVTLSKEF